MAESTSVDDHLKCSVCLEFYSDPRRLPCDHVFCFTCLEDISRGSNTFSCPDCRQGVKLGPKGLHDLRQDRKIESIVSILKSVQKKDVEAKNNECGAHGKVADIYCKTCKKLVCNKCSFGGEHHSHTLIEMENAIQIEKNNLSQQKQRILHCKEKLSESEVIVKKNTVDVRNKADDLLKELRNAFANLRDVLDNKERELEEKIERDISSIETKGLQALNQLQKLQENFKEYLNQIDACTDDLSVLKNSATLCERNSIAFAHFDSANISILRSKSVTPWKALRDVELSVSQTLKRINNLPAYTEDDNFHPATKVLQSGVSLDENLISFLRKSAKYTEIMNSLAREYNCTILWKESTRELHLQFEKYFESDIRCFQSRLASERGKYAVKSIVVENDIRRDLEQRLLKVTVKSPDDIAVLKFQNSLVCVGLRSCLMEIYNIICEEIKRARQAYTRSTSFCRP